MAKTVKSIFDVIEAVSEKAGKVASYLVVVMMAITALDVVARYVFNNPLLWGWLLNKQLFGVFILFAGVYTMSKGGHIRIEILILYDHFPPRVRSIARLIAIAAFICFMGVLVWQGSWMGWNSWRMRELAPGAFRIPFYPLKMLIPVVAFIFLVEGIVVFIRRRD